jgi:hypothetical protein
MVRGCFFACSNKIVFRIHFTGVLGMGRIKVMFLSISIIFCSFPVWANDVLKEPVLLWEREFNPPIRELSDQNSDGNFLAFQLNKEGSGAPKLLVIDSKGKTKREELLPKRRKRTIPADQLWLTATNEEELKQLKKAKKAKQIDTWGQGIFISGNGEYYGIVTRGIGTWYEFEYKDKNGKSLWKIYPKDNYGFDKARISYDGSKVVIFDIGGLGGGDEWEAYGQRVYFYDQKGKLLKDYDFKDNDGEWLNRDSFKMAPNGNYFVSTKGAHDPKNNDKSIVLFDHNGNQLWDKSFGKDRHYVRFMTNELMLMWNGNTYALLNLSGEKIEWEFNGDPNNFFTTYLRDDKESGTIVYFHVLDNLTITSPVNFKADDKNSLYVFTFNTGQLLLQKKSFVVEPELGTLMVSPDNKVIVAQTYNYVELFDNKMKSLWKREFPKNQSAILPTKLLTIELELSLEANKIFIYDLSSLWRK